MNLRRILSLPVLLWFVLFVLVPLLIVVIVSFASRGTYGGIEWTWSFDNYRRTLSSVYASIFWESFKLAFLTTSLCLVLGVPMAWAMATSSRQERFLYVCLIALPFLTNLVIRIYSIRLFVGSEGPLQALLKVMGFAVDPYSLSQNSFIVLYGMVTTYLPFMVLPLYGAFEKFDFVLIEAAQDLGAKSGDILRSVILPNLKIAIFSGSTLVFIPALGEYLIPDLLGGAKTVLWGNLITNQFLRFRDWPLGAALSVWLILLLLVTSIWFLRTSEKKT